MLIDFTLYAFTYAFTLYMQCIYNEKMYKNRRKMT